MAKDIFGKALFDYHHKSTKGDLLLHNTYGDPEVLPLDGYFFTEEDFSEMEDFALALCYGKILDIGAAAGRHTLHLQNEGLDVVAMDASPLCVKLMKQRGVQKVLQANIFDWKPQKFDTLFMMMNGIGLTGNPTGLGEFLEQAKVMLNPGGQLVFDSSDISYLYDDMPKPTDEYYGIMHYQYEYDGELSDKFDWLYVDQKLMTKIAEPLGWDVHVMYEDETDAYLARLTLPEK